MDANDLDRLVRAELPSALRLAVRLCGQADAAEEVVQESLFRAARSWRSFRGDCAFRTWFFRIVANVARDRVRAPPGAQELIDDPVDSRATSGPQRVLEQETAQRIAQEVSCLPPRQREVLVLFAYENHSIAEAAAVLGATEQNVRTNLHLARARLRERLASHLSDR